jgi:hypothetical protein
MHFFHLKYSFCCALCSATWGGHLTRPTLVMPLGRSGGKTQQFSNINKFEKSWTYWKIRQMAATFYLDIFKTKHVDRQTDSKMDRHSLKIMHLFWMTRAVKVPSMPPAIQNNTYPFHFSHIWWNIWTLLGWQHNEYLRNFLSPVSFGDRHDQERTDSAHTAATEQRSCYRPLTCKPGPAVRVQILSRSYTDKFILG